MADVPPASVVSATPATPPVTPSANNIVVETTLYSVPQRIQQLSRQIEVSGTLAEPPGGPTVTLNTAIGPLIIMLPKLAALQQDKLIQQLMTLFQTQRPLTVVMQPGNPPAQAFLLLPQITTAAQSAADAAYNPTTAAARALPPLAPNTVLSAIVLPDDAEFAFLPQGAMQGLPQGQTGAAALYPSLLPAPGGAANTTVPGSAAPNSASFAAPNMAPMETAFSEEVLAKAGLQPLPAASPGAAALQAAPLTQTPLPASMASLFQAGTELSLRVTTVIPPTPQGIPPQIPPLQPNQILATVVGNGPGGQIILKAGDATLFVRQPTSVPVGSQIVVTVTQTRTDSPPLLTLPDPSEMKTLPQIIAALAQVDPTAARQMIAASIPQPNATLPGALLFFLSAVRQGNLRSWIGDDATDMLTRAGKIELITRLADEMQQSVQSSRDPVVGEWRTYSVPVFDNNHLAMLYFHIHGDHRRHGSPQGKGDSKTAPGQVRFVIDVRMSRLGAMQLDGFLRPKKLDIVMRSERALPPGLDRDLRQTYIRTLESIGYAGAINFQNGRQGWIQVQKSAAAGAAVVT